MVGEKKQKNKTQNEPEVYFEPYLHLTSVSPDLESGPERIEGN